MFARILIANRGESAVRVIRACRELGVEPVAVYSDADAAALHVSLADRAVRLGPAPAADSYLAADAVLAAARETGAEAIHPGYGFLSENHDFAAACTAAGVAFIGPPADVIARMGSKIAARQLASQAGVPVVPGETSADQTDEGIAAAARRLGLPVLIKPSAGGGGIGMKRVREEPALLPAIAQSRREALASFGDGTLYVERLIDRPRHVEIQILADHHGHVIHLFERECSLQRRHQKVVEETPFPAATPALRARMGEAAVAVARAAGYRNAGTVEFLLEGSGDNARFYFLEMNTRLQVEHPITEQTTGVDLVAAQIRIAAGEPLPWSQPDVVPRGHAIEVRVYAEDPMHNDLPQAGPLLLYREPSMPGIRIDAGVTEGGEVSVHYDPMMAKLIAWAETRDAARRRAIEALRAYPILGIRTNIPFLIGLLEHPRVISGDIDTGFIDFERAALVAGLDVDPPAEVLAVAAQAAAVQGAQAAAGHGVGGHFSRTAADPWQSLRGWRAEPLPPVARTLSGPRGEPEPPHRAGVRGGDPGQARPTVTVVGNGIYRVSHGERHHLAWAAGPPSARWVYFDGRVYLVSATAPEDAPDRPAAHDDMALASPMPATVAAVKVAPGRLVVRGEVLIMLEAMKMELPIIAPRDGRVKSVACAPGELVQPGVPLVELE